MSAKTESKEAAPAPVEKAPAAAAKSGGMGKWIPAIAALVVAPVLSWAVAQFVMLPNLQKQLTAPAADAAAPAEEAAPEAAPAKEGKDSKDAKGGKESAASYDFTNVVVNLAGTMGTRYLKTSFTITGLNAKFKETIDGNKARLTDTTLSVLSSLTLSDLEEPGAKNVLRDKLVAAYNQVLGARVVDQVYFSDFLVQ